MPHYRPAPEYPSLADRLLLADRPPTADRPVMADRPLVPDRPLMTNRPVVADRPRAEDLPLVPDWPPVPDYPAVPPYLCARDRPPMPDWPAAPAWRHRALRDRLARLVPRRPVAGGTPGRRAAMAGYLTVPVFLVPLVIYLGTLRGPRWARCHAAQAVNVWFTGVLYDVSALIMGAMLALDSPAVALTVFVPLVAARWVVTLAYLARAARAAGRGAGYAFPAWLCMRVAR